MKTDNHLKKMIREIKEEEKNLARIQRNVTYYENDTDNPMSADMLRNALEDEQKAQQRISGLYKKKFEYEYI